MTGDTFSIATIAFNALPGEKGSGNTAPRLRGLLLKPGGFGHMHASAAKSSMRACRTAKIG